MTDGLCCENMDMEYFGSTFLKDKCFARRITCRSCGTKGTDYFDPNKGTNSDPIRTELDND